MLSGVLLIGALQRRLRIGGWVVLPLAFYLYAICLACGTTGAIVVVGSLFTVWIGGTAVGLAVQNGVSKLLIVCAGGCALLSSFVANLCGFDAYNEYQSIETGYVATTRFSGLMGNQNDLAIAAAVFAFLAIVLLDRNYVLKTTMVVFCIYATWLSGSRTGLMASLVLAVLLAIYPLVYMPQVRQKYVFILTVVLVGLAPVVAGWIWKYGADIEVVKRTLAITTGREGSFEERKYFIGMGWDLFRARPVLGYGLDSFRVVSGTGRYSHNNFVELLVSGGLLFLVLFYSHHVVIARITLAMPGKMRYWLLGFIVYLMAQDMACIAFGSRSIVLALILLLVRMREQVFGFSRAPYARSTRWFKYFG
jgi:O-antigen ligase